MPHSQLASVVQTLMAVYVARGHWEERDMSLLNRDQFSTVLQAQFYTYVSRRTSLLLPFPPRLHSLLTSGLFPASSVQPGFSFHYR